ncbi:CoA transferase [Maricurvus nonylphenolicus]|uniref:CaiB/BaiF CoA-transferase family protein n=1 Tax=Maricurvus nonylphenolicus TaxID=1008307 RepID=UPI0036F3A889
MSNTTENKQQTTKLLSGIRVIDLCDLRGQSCGRLLADLGADVILVEPIDGMRSRHRAPVYNGTSLHFEIHNANKKSIKLNFSDPVDLDKFKQLIQSCDLVIDGRNPAEYNIIGMSAEDIRQLREDLIVLSLTDFGLTGPYKDFIGSEAVHLAMGAVLSRSGVNGSDPILPPGELASETAAIQACWVALLAYWQKLHNGQGDLLDFSINDAVAQIFDPGVGATGSAAAGRTAIETAINGRPIVKMIPGKLPSVALLYPIFKCADGHIRICLLNPRQWQGMSEWLGDNHPFRHPKYETNINRIMKVDKINKLLAEFFSDKPREQLVIEGQKRGIPIAALSLPAEVFDEVHFQERSLYTDYVIGSDNGLAPSGYCRVDQQRIGIKQPAPKLGQDNEQVLSQIPSKQAAPQQESTSHLPLRKPLAGITVLDLGIIVAGGDLGRLFADQGANVIKVENHKYADGLRQSLDGNPVPISFAQANRNKRSLGLNLRSNKGKALFKELVKTADIVISNFKPGTMESLGLGFDILQEVNPGIICAESSAMGSFGPKAKTMGYGPLVRASSGLSGLWRYPGNDIVCGDSITIFPDHFAARISAVAIMAKLIERQQTGVGGFVDVSQAETIINALATELLNESLNPGSLKPKGGNEPHNAPNGLFPCDGDDEWVAISVTNDTQWQALCRAMKKPELANDPHFLTSEQRLLCASEITHIVSEWTRTRSPYEIMRLCQREQVPAGNMLRLTEFLGNPHFQARKFFNTLHQPTAGRPLETENGPVGFSQNLPQPIIKPAPVLAEHTREVAKELLQLDDGAISALVASGDLELAKKQQSPLKQKMKTKGVTFAMNVILKYHAFKNAFNRDTIKS